jgi:hypothetical protein
LLQVEPGTVQATLWIHGLPGESGPDLGHPLDAGPGRVAGEGHSIEGAHRSPVDPIRNEAVFGEHLQHPDLEGPPGPPSGHHQRGQRARLRLVGVVDIVLVFGQPLRSSSRGPLEGETEHQYQQDRGDHDEEAEDDGERRDRRV